MNQEIANAFHQIKTLLPGFASAEKHETKLLRALLNRLECQVTGVDKDYDYWGVAAGEYAVQMLEECELPVLHEA